jgi:hypothetical protein
MSYRGRARVPRPHAGVSRTFAKLRPNSVSVVNIHERSILEFVPGVPAASLDTTCTKHHLACGAVNRGERARSLYANARARLGPHGDARRRVRTPGAAPRASQRLGLRGRSHTRRFHLLPCIAAVPTPAPRAGALGGQEMHAWTRVLTASLVVTSRQPVVMEKFTRMILQEASEGGPATTTPPWCTNRRCERFCL